MMLTGSQGDRAQSRTAQWRRALAACLAAIDTRIPPYADAVLMEETKIVRVPAPLAVRGMPPIKPLGKPILWSRSNSLNPPKKAGVTSIAFRVEVGVSAATAAQA